MKRTREEKLLNPKPGSRIAEARDYGIDLTLMVENLKQTPSQRIKNNDSAVNDMLRFENAVRRSKQLRQNKTK